MASTMAKVCQIAGVMIAVCILTVSAQGCTENGGCTNGEICWKASGCDQGRCRCAPNWYKDTSGNCIEVSTLLGKDDTCSQESKTDRCDSYDLIGCTGCPEDPNAYKCRSGSTTLQISILSALSPIVIAFFL